MAGYVPLWCKSNHSFLEGASHPSELLQAAARFDLSALALTDRDGVYGVVRAHQTALEVGVKLIVGAQVSLEDDSSLVLLAQDRPGYANLCRLLTAGRLRSAKGECVVDWDEVCAHAEGLLALWGGEGSLLLRPRLPKARLHARVEALHAAFGDRLYALLARHRRSEEAELEPLLVERARRHGLPLVAGVEVLYHGVARRPLQDVLTCIRHGVTLDTAGRLLRSNAEHGLKTATAMATLFQDRPDALARTLEVADRCGFDLRQLRYRYPAERLPDGTSSAQLLRQLCMQGAQQRYGGQVSSAVQTQLDRELAVIDELDYCGYFLTMWEIVTFCRESGILCQGRGSAANSAVCFCLGITAVDPVRMDLLFERFLSKERNEPPDIDLDITHERREEVIAHVYAKYGRRHAAMVANQIRYRSRSAVRDVGRALGLPETDLDRVARHVSHYEPVSAEELHQAGVDSRAPAWRHLVGLCEQIQDFPRHLSIHPGGFLLGDQPVHDLVPIENASMAGRTVIQWDKYDVEALGLFKVDLLGLGALSHLDRCFRLLHERHGVHCSMASIPPDDSETFDMICRGDTVGVFQIESRAQMAMLPRLRPRCYYDLVVEVAIVRPGPISGGMVHPYLRRRNGQEAVEYPHPSLRPVLEKTLGVPLFQEQVMRLAVVAADYTPGEADQLRRDMGAWRRNGSLEGHRERLLSRMLAKGIEAEFAERVFEQIRGFGEYGFPESHSASFALISYATAWLRCRHPVEFTCALLNAQPMGFYVPATLVDDARRRGVSFHPVSVCHSRWDCTLEDLDAAEHAASAVGPSTEAPGRSPPERLCCAIRMGLRYVKGLGLAAARRIEVARPFADAEDFVRRVGASRKELRALAEAGALEDLGLSPRQALWTVEDLANRATDTLALPDREVPPLLKTLDLFERIGWDYRRTDHSTRGHPLAPLRALLGKQGLPDARALRKLKHGARVRYAGLVICRQRPATASGVTFMTLEDETGFVSVVIWKPVFERFVRLVKTATFLGISGRIQAEGEVVHLVAEQLWLPDIAARPERPRSRDFH